MIFEETMKKLIFTCLFLYPIVIPSLAAAAEVIISVGEPPTGTCDQYHDVQIKMKDEHYLINEAWNIKDKYIALSTSAIYVWESKAGMLQGCRTSSDWHRMSEVIPANTRVVSYGANCKLNDSSQYNGEKVYIKFREQIGDVTRNGNKTFKKNYSTYKNGVWEYHKITYGEYYIDNYKFVPDNKACILLHR
jgi:hypothetical protein